MQSFNATRSWFTDFGVLVTLIATSNCPKDQTQVARHDTSRSQRSLFPSLRCEHELIDLHPYIVGASVSPLVPLKGPHITPLGGLSHPRPHRSYYRRLIMIPTYPHLLHNDRSSLNDPRKAAPHLITHVRPHLT